MRPAPLLLSVSLLTAACAGGGDDAGPITDLGGKEDGVVAGIAENSFDAMGVLNAAATLDEAGWKAEIGVSKAAAKRLVAAQEDPGFGTVGVPSLAGLVAIGKLKNAQVAKLLAFARAGDLVPTTSLKIPVMNQAGTFLFKLNGEMNQAGLAHFHKFMFMWPGAAGSAQWAFNEDLGVQAAQEHDIDGAELSTGAGLIAGDGAGTICYVGDPAHAVDAVEVGIGLAWTEMMSIFGWRVGHDVVMNPDLDATEDEMLDLMDDGDVEAWNGFDEDGTTVMISNDTGDGGDSPSIDVIDRCPPA